MFSVPSPFAWAAVIGKPGVLLFQRPGSVDSEVILGPWKRAWELGGGCWADKNQTWLRQEHVELHTQKHVLCTCVIYRTYHSKCTKICTQADVLSYTGIHIFNVFEPASTQTEEMHTHSSRKCKDTINKSAQTPNPAHCFLVWRRAGHNRTAPWSAVSCPLAFAQTLIYRSQMFFFFLQLIFVGPVCYTTHRPIRLGASEAYCPPP